MEPDRRQPWFKFFPSDWRGDDNLQMCSLSARGLWAECVAIMHKSQPYGYLKIGNRKITEPDMTRLFRATTEEIGSALAELITWGVASMDDDGVIYSRRMVRRSEKVESARLNGNRGGRPRKPKTETVTQPETETETETETGGLENQNPKTNPHMPEARRETVSLSGGDLATAYGVETDPVLAERAGAFFERWRLAHERHRSGAPYPTIGTNRKGIPRLFAVDRDFRYALTLCDRYDDARLDEITTVFLMTRGDSDMAKNPKTLGWLCHYAAQIDEMIRERRAS